VKLTAVVPIFGPTYTSRKHDIEAILNNSPNIKIILVADSFEETDKQSINELINRIPHREIELIQGIFGNPGSARNIALDKIETDWFCFWDSDDMPDIQMYLEMVKSAEEAQSPIAKGGYKIVSHLGNLSEKIVNPKAELSHPAEHLSDPGLWRYVFSKKIYGELRFPPVRMGEDQDYLVQALMITDSVHIFPHLIYSYQVGGDNQLTQLAVNSEEVFKSLLFLADLKTNKSQTRRNNEIIVTSFLKQFATLLKRSNPKKVGKNSKFLLQFLIKSTVNREILTPIEILLKGNLK